MLNHPFRFVHNAERWLHDLTSSSGSAFHAVNGVSATLPAEAWQVFRVH